jgi:hypothetical protein
MELSNWAKFGLLMLFMFGLIMMALLGNTMEENIRKENHRICIENGFDGKIDKDMQPNYIMCYKDHYNENHENIKIEFPIYIRGDK